MKRLLITTIALLLSLLSISQNQANYWFFGENAGLNFGSGMPVSITGGALSTMEGCSSISTATGTLQFYTDGTDVWNRTNVRMPNGYGLKGDASSTQSAIIVPHPVDGNLYYIFTVDEVANGNGGTNGLNYSLVDMTLDGLKGDVVSTEKNILLTAPLCEKVTAVGHSNGFDTWVIAQKWGTNSFYCYLITADGVNTTPVISSVGDVIEGDINNAKGYMKVSPNGDKIAKANAGMGTLEIFSFNNTSGIVSNVIKDYISGTDPYGIEFSPNSSLLYVGSWYVGSKYLYQYNLDAGSPQEILDSQILIASGTEGALQLGPDNKIYAAQNGSGSISVINYPNEIGSACNFQWGAVSLGGNISSWGLPPFIQSFFSFNAGFYNLVSCFGNQTEFFGNSSQDPDSLFWNFGDPASGVANTSTILEPVHLYTAPGFFPVNLSVWINGIEITIFHMVLVNEMPDIQLPTDTAMCSGNYYTIDAGEGFESYLWQTGDTSHSITVNTSGTYWVDVSTTAGCTNSDTIIVEFFPNPIAEAGPTQTIIEGASTILEGEVSSGSGNYTYNWEPGEWLVQNNIPGPATLALTVPTVFTLSVEDDRGCVAEPDNVLINIEGAFLSAFPFADPSELCFGNSTIISANASGGGGEYSYSWTSDPSGYVFNTSEFEITPNAGTTKFFLTVSDQYSNSTTATVEVVVHPLPFVDLIPDGYNTVGDTILVCLRDSVWLDSGYDSDPDATTYFWENSNLLNRYYNASTNGNWTEIQTHKVIVTHGGSGCQDSGIVSILFDFNECMIGIPEEDENLVQFVDIFPNPNDGSFSLKLNTKSNNLSVKVYNLSGQMILENIWPGTFNPGAKIGLPLAIDNNGIYLVHITTDEYSTVMKVLVR